jgi:hypothetical protein
MNTCPANLEQQLTDSRRISATDRFWSRLVSHTEIRKAAVGFKKVGNNGFQEYVAVGGALR